MGARDQVPEHATSLGQVPDPLRGLLIDAPVHELLEPAVGAEHAQRPVAGAREAASRRDEPVEDGRRVELRGHRHDGAHERVEALVRRRVGPVETHARSIGPPTTAPAS